MISPLKSFQNSFVCNNNKKKDLNKKRKNYARIPNLKDKQSKIRKVVEKHKRKA
jgi:hypothetical protein